MDCRAWTVWIEVTVLLRLLWLMRHTVRGSAISIAINRMCTQLRIMHETGRRAGVHVSIRTMCDGRISMDVSDAMLRRHSRVHAIVVGPCHMPARLNMTTGMRGCQSKLAHDTLVPSLRFNGAQMWHDLPHKHRTLFTFRIIQSSLDDIVGIWIIDHLSHGAGSYHLAQQEVKVGMTSDTYALHVKSHSQEMNLLNNIRTKLGLRKLYNMILELANKWRQIAVRFV